MWWSNCQNIKMTDGDYGIALQIKFDGIELQSGDVIKFSLKKSAKTEAILERYYTSFNNNIVELALTEQESETLSVGTYLYSIDWYKEDTFMCNLVSVGAFEVVDKI